jgi:hypothetical protein
MGKPINKTSKRAIEARLRAQQAIELRLAGATYRTIAKQLNYTNPGAAFRAVCNAMAAITADSAEQLRAMEAERLDAMQLGLWQKARRGDVQAIDRVVRIMERRAKLFRLDPPEQKELSGPGGSPIAIEDARLMLADRFARLAQGGDTGGGSGLDPEPTG